VPQQSAIYVVLSVYWIMPIIFTKKNLWHYLLMFPVQVRHAVLITYFVCLQGLMRYAYDLDKDKEYQAGTVYVNGRPHTEHNLYDYANVSEYCLPPCLCK
jgi:hypothetical protein